MNKKPELYRELKYKHSPSLLKLLKDYILDKRSVKKVNYGEPKIHVVTPPDGATLFYFAIVVNGVVQETIRVNREIASLFNQDFKLIEYTPEATPIQKGWKHSEDGFSNGAA